jgi:hypothetical protein
MLIPLRNATSLVLKINSLAERRQELPLVAIAIAPAFANVMGSLDGAALWDLEHRCLSLLQESSVRYYPTNSQSRPLIYHSDSWGTIEAEIGALHQSLNLVSAIVIDTKLTGDSIDIYVSGWRKKSRSHAEFSAMSLPIDRLITEGMKSFELSYNGGLERDFFYSLADGVGVCYAAIAYFLTDYYYYSSFKTPPKLPTIYPEIFNSIRLQTIAAILLDWLYDNYEEKYGIPFAPISKQEMFALLNDRSSATHLPLKTA